MTGQSRQPEFTGRHMLMIMVAFFGVVIAVNLAMATLARTSWTGFVVENTYVASQQFNTKMAETRAQAALGWTGTLSVRGGSARYSLADHAGRPVRLTGVALTFMRPVDDREDRRIVLDRASDGSFATADRIADGVWLVEVEADAGLQKPYRETLRIHVAGGDRS